MPHKDKEQARAYKAAWRAKNADKMKAWEEANRERTREQRREWWRKKHGSVPREEYLAQFAAKKAAMTEEETRAQEQRKREQAAARQAAKRARDAAQKPPKVSPVSLTPPAPATKPAPRAGVSYRKPGRLLAAAGFVRNW